MGVNAWEMREECEGGSFVSEAFDWTAWNALKLRRAAPFRHTLLAELNLG